MKHAATLALLACLVAALSGCSFFNPPERALAKRYRTNDYPVNPVPAVKTVGLLVLDASTRYHPDLGEFSSSLHSQLQSVEGLEVLPAGAAELAIQQNNIVLPRDGLKLADALAADGVFVGVVTDYDPYDEPVISMALMLFSRKAAPVKPLRLDRVIQGGRPVDLPASPAQNPIIAVFGVYDASQKTTRRRLQLFAEGQTASDVGLGWERYYRTMSGFMRFVSYELVWKLFDEIEVQKSVRENASGT